MFYYLKYSYLNNKYKFFELIKKIYKYLYNIFYKYTKKLLDINSFNPKNSNL